MTIKINKPYELKKEDELKLESIVDSERYVVPLTPATKYNLYILKDNKLVKYDKRDITNEIIVIANKNIIYDILYIDGISLIDLTLIQRLKHLKKLKTNFKIAAYKKVDNNFYSTLSKFFEGGGKELIIYDSLATYNMSNANGWHSCKIGHDFLTTLVGTVLQAVPPKKDCDTSDLGEWLYWEDLKSGKLLEIDQRFSDYLRGATIAPVSEAYFFNKPSGSIIKAENGLLIKTNKNIEKGKIVKIGCVKIEEKIYHPYVMED